ncbi:MAG: hypothetical protein AAB110_04360 [Candidatus Desantisbacteria bacterium]
MERDGGGSLSEETLAIALCLSAKSSGFHLKTLTARQFGLLTKQGETLSTTPLAKAIFKPKNEDEKKRALAESFLAIHLFREVANRFRGQNLPQGSTLRNILEREFGIDSKRVTDAERMLMDSARETGVLITSGGNTYLSTERTTAPRTNAESLVDQPPSLESLKPTSSPPPVGVRTPHTDTGLLTITEEDLASFDDEEFNQYLTLYLKIMKDRVMKDRVRIKKN